MTPELLASSALRVAHSLAMPIAAAAFARASARSRTPRNYGIATRPRTITTAETTTTSIKVNPQTKDVGNFAENLSFLRQKYSARTEGELFTWHFTLAMRQLSDALK